MLASLLLIATASATAPAVSVQSLLPEMTDLARLARRPSPSYTLAQASSYDRRSKTPGNDDWFANSDAGQYDRTEEHGDRTEFVMADLKGPGAVVRIWSANPNGTIRFYFDDEATPRFVQKMADLLSGKVPGLGEPFSYMADRGANLYYPLPYSKRLVITVDDSDQGARRLYYHVGYRTYTEPVEVASFEPKDIEANAATMASVAAALVDPSKLPTPGQDTRAQWTLKPGDTEVIDLPEGPGAVTQLRVRARALSAPTGGWADPAQPHNFLRRLILNVQADDEDCVNTPLGDFFGSAPGVNPYTSVPLDVKPDGTMTSRWVMPYKTDAVVVVSNTGQAPIEVTLDVKTATRPFDEATYYFRAGWGGENGPTRPHHDMTFLDATGEGVLVGSALHVANPVPDWWGEGDEKIFVDGEKFPSTFGTGTEDYYGYAWSSNKTFQRPYHAQPKSGDPGTRGNGVVNRWHVFDPIPFTRSLKFDLENWHWADVQAGFLHTVYWYSRPGGSPPGAIRNDLLDVPEFPKPEPVKGAIEGEGLTIVSRSGGTTEAQEGFWQLSGQKQLWWKEVKPGDKLVLRVPVPKAGTYEVIGVFCHARDYGIHRMLLNGKDAGTVDFYSSDLKWERSSLGVFDLPAGDAPFQIECVGERAGAIPSRMFGLDYLLLVPK